jgi:hypothetical protein
MNTALILLFLTKLFGAITESLFVAAVFKLVVVVLIGLAVVVLVILLLRSLNMPTDRIFAALVAVGLTLFGISQLHHKVDLHVQPVGPSRPDDAPKKRRLPFPGPLRVPVDESGEASVKADPIPKGKSVVAGPTYQGEEVTADLSPFEQFRNIGSKIDQAGMCVDTSIEEAALFLGLEQMRGFRDWAASKFPGGNYPQGVDKQLGIWFKEKQIPPVPYKQFSDKSPEELLHLLDTRGLPMCVTYGYSPRYNKEPIYHMVVCTRFRGGFCTIWDNNFIAVKKNDGTWDESSPRTGQEWMSEDEGVRRLKRAGGAAWVFYWDVPPPPPIPWTRGTL